jgi:hypothetical protein
MAGGGEVKESYRKADGDLLEERFDCGTGAGGFKEGNTCAGGGDEGISEKVSGTKKYPKVIEIENKIKKLGVEKVDLFNNSKSAEKVLSQVEEIKKKGYAIPSTIDVVTTDTRAIAWANRGTRISLNSKYSKRYEELSKQQEASGNWSSSSPIAHETGHNLHYQKIGNERFGRGNNWPASIRGPIEITSQVSKYARMNPIEFVAETFAGHISGKKYSKEVYDLYKFHEGPDLK